MLEKLLVIAPGVFQIMLFVAFVLTVCQIVLLVKKMRTPVARNTDYSAETEEQTDAVMRAVRTGVIKKHILSDNTAKEYDSRKTLDNYRNFLDSSLMQEISKM